MAWMSYQDSCRRIWAIDPEGCAQLLLSAHYNRLMALRSRIIRVDLGFFMPTLTQVETNHVGIVEAATEAARTYVEQISRDISNNPQGFYEHLVRVREHGEDSARYLREMHRQASQQTARAIDGNTGGWANALAAARFVRDAAAGTLLVGATVLSGGSALALGAAGTGLTFTGNTQDNLFVSNQTMRQAVGNAAVSTSIAVVTTVLIPQGLSAAGRGMVGAGQRLSAGQNVALGLLSVQANVAGGIVNTALTADPQMTAEARRQFQQQATRQVGASAATEMASMLFGAWLQSRGLPAAATLELREELGRMRDAVSGGVLSTIGSRIVTAMSAQQQAPSTSQARNLHMAFTQLQRTVDAEAYVRAVAMRPA